MFMEEAINDKLSATLSTNDIKKRILDKYYSMIYI